MSDYSVEDVIEILDDVKAELHVLNENPVRLLEIAARRELKENDGNESEDEHGG